MDNLAPECEDARLLEMSKYEQEFWTRGICYIAGIDEAGRGPLAGPVTAAAVILPQDCQIEGINDSKKLSEKKRLVLEDVIKKQALAWSCVSINHLVIDNINILEASRLAMSRAVQRLQIKPQLLLIDALSLQTDIPQKSLIHGDALSISIAAASIIAKNTRDRLMLKCDQLWPEYGFAKHKGYPTVAHKEALHIHGYCPIHRKSFKY